ncbi:MAG TPA: DUF5678 domain-containing protein [Phycisphaerae bacterium]|jgi:hypothetical protein
MASADFKWFVDHSLELYEKYPGKWIAVCQGEVVGTGETAVEAADQARERARDGKFLLVALDETDLTYGDLPVGAAGT